jgi:glycosyltransferase involved in cell wall biosynthesis
MKIHVLGLPHTQTTEEFTTCAFTQKTLNLCKMLHRRGHHVIHYGVEGGSPECTEHVDVMSEKQWSKEIGKPGTAYYNTSTEGVLAPYHALFAKNMHEALAARSGRPYTEIVCETWGGAQKTACEGIEQYLVESGIGYPESWAEWRVYESYAWMHMHLGRDRLFGGGKWYWAVIPNAFDLKNFTPNPSGKRGEDFLYIGRLNEDKGVGIAIEVAKEIGRKIVIVGQGDPHRFLAGNPHTRYMKPVGIEARRKLLANASAVFCLTQFVEPFCGTNVEAQLSGTPVITSDHGIFPESVLHGVTGYRGRTFEQWVWAAKNIDRIDGRVCREWAEANYSLERVALMYEEYFQQLLNMRDWAGSKARQIQLGRANLGPTGFYERHPGRTQLDWLARVYPQAAAEVTLDLTRAHEAPVVPVAIAATVVTATSEVEWKTAQAFEADWWGLDWSPRWDEEVKKQETYHRLMGIGGHRDFNGAKILDVGCGPVSLLQRTKHGPSRGVDPLPMSKTTRARYLEAGVELLSMPAEEMPTDETFDEIWMYNLLQHTRDPREILRRITACSETGTNVRIFEWLDMGVSPGHPQNLAEALFDGHFRPTEWSHTIWNVGTIKDGDAHGKYIAIHVTRL